MQREFHKPRGMQREFHLSRGLRKPISVWNFIAGDEDEELVVRGIRRAIEEAISLGWIWDGDISRYIEKNLAPAGVVFKVSAYGAAKSGFDPPFAKFPKPIAEAWGHSTGGIDLYAEFNGKLIGIEDEPIGWYRACEPEVLKLGWISGLDYRICAWGTRQRATIERFKGLEMLPFPHEVVVVTRSEIMRVRNGS